MGIFNVRKKEEDDFEEVEEVVVKKRPKSKAFRDLNPENRKKRKEPKKPWGRMERILITLVLLLTAGTSGIFALSARSWKLPGLPRFKLPSFELPFFSGETIVIEADKESQKDKVKKDIVIQNFNDLTQELSGVYGLYIVRLENGYSFGVNEEETFQAASLIKLPVMAAMYKEEENGKLKMENRYTLKNSDKIPGSGSLYSKPAGYQVTYGNLVQLMGKQSDNTAFNICRNHLGDEKIENVINSIGMSNTSLVENETTPKDIGIFFEELWRGNIISDENKLELLDVLTETIYEDWLSEGLPDDIRIAHKYGRELHVVNDAGIVYSQNPYIIVILTKGVVEKEADEILPELSGKIFDLLNQ